MGTEIEARFLEVDVSALVRRLREIGAEDRGEDLLKETIFYDQELAWQRSGRVFVRVRESRNGVSVSYKNALEDSASGTQEIEFTADDREAVEQFLAMVGLVAFRRQEKKRHAFRLNGISIDIDTWPQIPSYAEIEGPVSAQLNSPPSCSTKFPITGSATG